MPKPSPRVSLDDFASIPDLEYIDAIADLEAARQAARSNGTESTWQPLNLGQLEERPPLRPTLGGVGIVYPGKRHVFSGPQESAKTLAAYAICIETVRAGGIAVVIDFEMGRWDARDRFRELGATPHELAGIYYVEPAQPATPEHIGTLVALEPLLVIVDAAAGAYDLQGLDDNKRQDVERFTRLYVRDFWLAGIATIVLDHVVKNLDSRGSYAIGSERKVGGADVHLGFTTVMPISRGTNGIYKITTHKDRGGYLQRGRLADLHLTSDPDTHQIGWEFKEAEHHDPDDNDFRPTRLMEKVSRWLEEEGGEHSGNQIEKAVEGKGTYVRQAVKKLVDEGFVSRKEAGTNPGRGHKYSHLTSYREADDLVPVDPSIQADSDFVPTSSHLVPDEVPTTSSLVPPLRRGDEVRTRSEVDVFDPAVQAMLDGPDQDHDIPF